MTRLTIDGTVPQRIRPRNQVIFASVIATAVVVLTAACDEPASKVPTGPDTIPPGASGVEISGPATLAPGQAAQLTASIRLADGSLKIAEPSAIQQWRVGDPFVLQVNQAGVVTAQPRVGETTLSVDVRVGTQSRTATREIVVVPEGTFRLVGRITEEGFPNQSVGGAKVEVVQSPVSTVADFAGQYRLYGVPASAVIRITASGYADLEQAVSLTSHVTRHFEMDLSGPRPTPNGPYTLSIDAVSTCRPELASDLQHRRYDAFLTTNGPNIEVELTEPRFRLNSLGRGNKFTGRTIGNGVIFNLRPYTLTKFLYYYDFFYIYASPNAYPDVAERLPDNTFLVPEGQATTNLTGNSLSGVLSGQIARWDSQFPSIPRGLSLCIGTTHQFVLTPR